MAIFIPHQVWVKIISKDKSLKKQLHAATFKAPSDLKMPNTWIKRNIKNDLTEWVVLLRNLRSNKIEHTLLDLKIEQQTKINFDD